MMKFLLATAAVTAMTVGAASAKELSFGGGLEYAVEAETLEATVGAEYVIGQFTLSPVITIVDLTDNVDFDSLAVTASYAATEQVTAYVKIETDADLAYEEATLGVAFKF